VAQQPQSARVFYMLLPIPGTGRSHVALPDLNSLIVPPSLKKFTDPRCKAFGSSDWARAAPLVQMNIVITMA